MMMLLLPGHRSCRLSRACSKEHGRCGQNWKCGFHDDLLVEECDSKRDMCPGFEFCMRQLASGSAPMAQRKGPGLSPGPSRPLQKRVGLLASAVCTANPAARAASTARARGVKARRRDPVLGGWTSPGYSARVALHSDYRLET